MYKFEPPLEIGKIISRPNRFIMNIEKDGNAFVGHCPSTGKIGNISLDGFSCLLSKSNDPRRKTAYTVEAIYMDQAHTWVGINQNAVNRYVEHFFKNGCLDGIAKAGHKVLREQKVGTSKLDFKIENTYLEVKMPLKFLPCAKDSCQRDVGSDDNKTHVLQAPSYERFVRHITELGDRLRESENAVLIVCFMYDAPMFIAPKPTEKTKIISDAVRNSAKAGVKMWQVNMCIDRNGVNLLQYFDITHLFL
jgi:sugar fermentation stimulation protein A